MMNQKALPLYTLAVQGGLASLKTSRRGETRGRLVTPEAAAEEAAETWSKQPPDIFLPKCIRNVNLLNILDFVSFSEDLC